MLCLQSTSFFTDKSFDCYIDADLVAYCKDAQSFSRRYCFEDAMQYLKDTGRERIGILYGLRRTGKTVLMQQLAMQHADRSVYIICNASKTLLSDVLNKIRELKTQGYKYFYVDEITFCSDFIDIINLLPPLAGSDCRIVCAGTDSFGFILARHYLYDRTYMIHTTYISYKEYTELVGGTIDDYIHFGGTFLKGRAAKDKKEIIAPYILNKDIREYIDTSIVSNLLHSVERLSEYENLAKYEPLVQVSEMNMLREMITLAVNRAGFSFAAKQLHSVVSAKDIAHASRVLSRRLVDWKQGVYLPSEQQLTKPQLEELELAIQILNDEDFIAAFWDSICIQTPRLFDPITYIQKTLNLLQSYLFELDVLYSLCEVQFTLANNEIIARQNNVVSFSQPGLLYGYTKQLLAMVTPTVHDTFVQEIVTSKIETISLGEILEVVVATAVRKELPEGQYYIAKCKFNLQQTGEYDLAVCDMRNKHSTIIEVKHSDKFVPEQAKHLWNKQFQTAFETSLPKVTRRIILYAGKSEILSMEDFPKIEYINVSDFLTDIPGVLDM